MAESYVVLTQELLDQAQQAETKAKAREKAHQLVTESFSDGKPLRVVVAKIVELGTVRVDWDAPGKAAVPPKKKARKKPKHGVRPWTEKEEAELEVALKKGLTHQEIGKKLKRTPKAVSLRASKLGLTSPSS